MKYLCCFFCLFIFFAIGESFADSEKAAFFFRSGLDKYVKQDYKSALADFESALKENSAHPGAPTFIKKCRTKIGKPEKTSSKDKTSSENILGSAQKTKKEISSASAKANKFFKSGLDKYLKTEYNSAVVDFARALSIDSSNKGAKVFLKKSREQINKKIKANETAEKRKRKLEATLAKQQQSETNEKQKEDNIENLAQRRAARHYQKGLAFYNAHNYAMALKEWDLSMIWEPENSVLEAKILNARDELSKIAEANLLEKRIGQAYTYYQEGRFSESLEYWRLVQLLDPANVNAMTYIDSISEQLSRKEKQAYQLKMKAYNSAEALKKIDLGRKALLSRQYDRARKYFEESRRLDETNPKSAELLKRSINEKKWYISKKMKAGWLFYNDKKPNAAIKAFNDILKVESENKEALRGIKQSKKLAGDLGRVAKQKEVKRLYYKAADLYVKSKYQEAEILVSELLEKDPSNIAAEKLLFRIESALKLISR